MKIRRAFTLVELMVVIGIIALLMSLFSGTGQDDDPPRAW